MWILYEYFYLICYLEINGILSRKDTECPVRQARAFEVDFALSDSIGSVVTNSMSVLVLIQW